MTEQIGTNSPDGALVKGERRQVISGEGATRILLPSDSGAYCVFDRAAGIVFTLPPPVVGMYFEFITTVIGTGSYTIDTDAATTFIGGGIIGASATVTAFDLFAANIASTVSIDLDSATTGEEVGTHLVLTALSSTTWSCNGYTAGTGTPVTPFA